MTQGNSFSRRLRARVLQRHWQEIPRSGIASGRQSAVGLAFRPDPVHRQLGGLRFAQHHPPKKEKRRRNADRRVFNGRISGCGARSKAERARLSAFHRGTCGSERTPPLNSSYALPGTVLGRNGRYPLPAVIQYSDLVADRSSCRSGVFTQSRPGVAVTSRHPREPHSPHRSASPATSLTRAR